MAHGDYPIAEWGSRVSEDEADYYVVSIPQGVREAAVITLAICTRCGVPVYENDIHDEFHRKQEAVRGAMSDVSSGQ